MIRAAARLAAAAFGAALLWPAHAGAQETPICTDRPTKANALCTVPAGRFQIEATGFSWTRTSIDGNRTEVLAVGAPVLKLGLTDRSDLQIGFAPLVQATTYSPGLRTRVTGVGDLTIRYKHRVTANDAPVQVALLPFVKLPTASRGLGNRRVEGGLAIPVSLPLGAATLTFGPEVDLLADADGRGRHVQLVGLVNLSGPVAPRLTAAVELWTAWNLDPAGTVRQASLDGALAYALTPRLQLDGGINVGLTRDTPDIEIYTGISIRF